MNIDLDGLRLAQSKKKERKEKTKKKKKVYKKLLE